MTEEHKLKIKVARDAYWARVRAEKNEAKEVIDESEPAPLADHIVNSFNGPAKNPQPPTTPPISKPTLLPPTPRERTQSRVNKKLEKLLDAQIDLATGLYYVTADGKHVYKQKPDGGRGEYLLNQLIGKPKESIEVKSINLKIDI